MQSEGINDDVIENLETNMKDSILQAPHFAKRNEDDIGLQLHEQRNDFAQKYLFRGTSNDLID